MIEVEFQILIRKNGKLFLRSSTVKLLREIERRGSLRIAAQELAYSYQHTWDIVNEINRIASQPVVIKQRGGIRGGGAKLSAYGHRLLDEFNSIERTVQTFSKKMNAEINF
jgi:molybdate transport system regulatory protein